LSYDEAKALGLTVPKNRAEYGKTSEQVDRKSATEKRLDISETHLVDFKKKHVLTTKERWERGIDFLFVFCFFFCVSYIVLLFSPILKNDMYALIVKRKSLEYKKDIDVLIEEIKS